MSAFTVSKHNPEKDCYQLRVSFPCHKTVFLTSYWDSGPYRGSEELRAGSVSHHHGQGWAYELKDHAVDKFRGDVVERGVALDRDEAAGRVALWLLEGVHK